MLSALPLIGALLFAAAPAVPSIDLAFAERRGPRTADLLLREADARLMALCFDPVGLAPEAIEHAQKRAIGQPIWLYQGPRRIARGSIESLEASPDPALACAVVARASFDRPLPLIARGDVLWATTKSLDSSPRESVSLDVVERARRSLPAELAEACLDHRQANARRGTRLGTYVGFVCAPGEAPISTVVFVPKKGAPRVLFVERGDYGTLRLVDVLDPGRTDRHRLVMSREWSLMGARRFELWEDDGTSASPAASEALFSDMMFLIAEEAHRQLEMPELDADEAVETTSEEAPDPASVE
jgi:hypothetical protein